MANKIQRSGWKASSFDSRDLIFKDAGYDQTLQKYFLNHLIEPRNQGWGTANVPCCVSCAITAAMEIVDVKIGSVTEMSELFHYFVARNSKYRLSAIDFRQGFKTVINHGIAPREYHPYPVSRATPMKREDALISPSSDAIKAAKNYRIAYDIVRRTFKYRTISNYNRIEFWKTAIQRQNPVIFGFWMTEAYSNIKPENPYHGVIEGMKASDGHAALAIGYDEQIKSFLIKDSRGASFGKEGSWWLNYLLVETDFVNESWVIEGITTDE